MNMKELAEDVAYDLNSRPILKTFVQNCKNGKKILVPETTNQRFQMTRQTLAGMGFDLRPTVRAIVIGAEYKGFLLRKTES